MVAFQGDRSLRMDPFGQETKWLFLFCCHRLWKFKSCVGLDCITEFFFECAFLPIVRKFEQIKTSGWGGQSTNWIVPPTNAEKPAKHTAYSVTFILVIITLHASNRKRRLKMSKSQQRRFRATRNELKKSRFFVLGKVFFQYIPQPIDYSVIVMITTVISCVTSANLEGNKYKLS